ncbi:squalene/phytoene synthase family protein [Herbiconiux sp. L3-i23]|uniref:phytoene/squalene synthase family protein n=1 Tax=Herbiconiux sp. L3-i23 TaxID=2905871 RepID=UPI002060A771|nr:squalene/phytoene synthase family protein [Herbiconiux sp. L3-i23]BDI24154.1 phytoene synthase [Herbiconiux sp. L3-i23]
MTAETGSELYLSAAEAAARVVIGRYSTSFGAASRLLGREERRHVANIYALVRVADEIVDGVAAEAGLSTDEVGERLDELERELDRALDTGYSTDLVVHAFAATARRVGFGRNYTAPFFRSMRSDLVRAEHDDASFNDYVYGSAEVVGLMCLAAFLDGHNPSKAQRARFESGARALGAAFQKVNFLRDLAADYSRLGRSYFPGIDVPRLDEADKARLLDDLDADLAQAAAVIPQLPRGSRRAVAAAHGLFAALSRRIADTPAARLRTTRISVPTAVKLKIVARAAATGRSE